jgi:hypothetical protein
MKRNRVEKILMNNPIRAFTVGRIETRYFGDFFFGTARRDR